VQKEEGGMKKVMIIISLLMSIPVFAETMISVGEEFFSSGESTQSLDRAREGAEASAHGSCFEQNVHYLAERVSPFNDSSYPRKVCNPWHQPSCRNVYVFTTTAKFRCFNGGGW